MVAIPLVSSTSVLAEASQIIGTLNTNNQTVFGLLAPAGPGSMASAIFLPAASSQINLLSITGGASGSPVLVGVGGPSAGTNVDLILSGAAPSGVVGLGGIGTVKAGAALQVLANSTNVNGIQIAGAGSGSDPAISVFGSDSNRNLVLSPLGTGTIKFGTTGMISANGTVGASMTTTSAPTGASTAIQRWLTFIDSTGRAGFIPVW